MPRRPPPRLRPPRGLRSPACPGPARAAGTAALCLVLALGCALNPVTGTPEVVLTSTEREIEVGRRAAQEVARTLGLVEDPELVAYVQAVGARLAAQSPRTDVPYHFDVVDMSEPNAFALPGGPVFVSWGMLALLNREDELAGVLAHEVVHVAARHAVQRQSAALPVGVLSALGALAGGLVGGANLARVVGGIPDLAGGLVLAKYGRDQEREADRVGQELAARAGWDPAALADALVDLERAVAVDADEADTRARGPSWFDSHPGTEERVAAVRQRAADLAAASVEPIAQGRAGYLQRIEGMRVGPDPREGVFRKTVYMHPDLGFALHFPAGWRTHNGREAVAAVSPQGDAVLVLRLQARGDDPEAAAVAFARESGVTLTDLERFRIGGRPAVRGLAGVRADSRTFVADFTFVAHRGLVYRITGAAPVALYEDRAPALLDAVRSFRDLSDAELGSFRIRRLRLARARPGETLAALSARTGNVWSLERTAAANRLDAATPLPADTLVKIALAEPYVPQPPEASATPGPAPSP